VRYESFLPLVREHTKSLSSAALSQFRGGSAGTEMRNCTLRLLSRVFLPSHHNLKTGILPMVSKFATLLPEFHMMRIIFLQQEKYAFT